MQADSSRMRDNQKHILELRRDNAKEMGQLVKTLMFGEYGTFWATDQGVRIFANDGHSMQADVYMSSDLFSKFTIREEHTNFTLPLLTLMECISMLDGPSSNVQMFYDGVGHPLRLMVEEDGIVVDASIPTVDADMVQLDFDMHETAAKLIMRPSILRDTIKELDPSSSAVCIRVSPQKISFLTMGELGRIQTVFPKDSDEMEKFDCASTLSYCYKSSIIKRMNPSLAIADKVCLQMDINGMLNVQFMLEMGENGSAFIDFKCVPNARDQEEE